MKRNEEQFSPRIIGVILARGGSKAIPRKNIRLLNGHPLIAYTVCEALRSKKLNRLIVSTDDQEIQNVAIRYGAEAPFLRPAYLSTDTATSNDALEHAVDWAEENEGKCYDYVVEMLCTNPMKTSGDIDGCIEKLIQTGAESVIGVTRLEDHHPLRIKKIVDDRIVDFCLKEIPGSHRQTLKPDAYIRNGSIYACRRDCIHTRTSSENSRPYIMPEERSINIDTLNDFYLVEILLKTSPRDYVQPAQKKTSWEKIGVPGYIPSSSQERRVLITTVPFGDYDDSPIELLKKSKVDYVINPLGRRPTENETIEMIKDFGVLLAGTSPVTRKVMDATPYLRLIARAGIGLDNIDLLAAKEKGIQVTYTPQAPAPAVAEFAVGCMLALLRHIPQVNQDLHKGLWKRQIGRRLGDCTVGLAGVGFIGKLVIKYLQGFGARVLGFDLRQSAISTDEYNFQWVDKERLMRESDIISLHLPLTQATRYFITRKELGMMKSNALIINSSRGGIIHEEDLREALQSRKIAGAALDVFEKEPYEGPLAQLDNCLLTSHMAAASVDCKRAMEVGAVQEVLNYLAGKPLKMVVPPEAYKEQQRGDICLKG